MFDDPKKELQRLQQRLLEAEEPEPILEEAELDELKLLLDTDDWEGTHRQPLYQSYSEEAEEDSYADWLPEEDAPEEPVPVPRKKSLGGLIAALILETLALVGVVLWWLLWR